MEEKRLSELASKFLHGISTPEEEAELHAWWNGETNKEEEQVVITAEPETFDSVRTRILDSLNAQIDSDPAIPSAPRLRRLDRRWLIAASLIFLAAATAIIIPLSRKQTAAGDDNLISAARDIKPGGARAMLELAGGRTILLDTAKVGLLAWESGTTITKKENGLLSYAAPGATKEEGIKQEFNTIHTPKGGQYRVILPDGSQVWLNTASSLKFPTAFRGKDRQVELSGEAYFEVTPDPGRPFNVLVSPVPGIPACEVTALGTQFDINSYEDETAIMTTLLQGSVLVSSMQKKGSEILKPGQQASLDKDHDLQVQENPNAAEVISWREGLFKFKDASIDEIMKQMARWYDIDVVYSGKIPEHFVSTLPMETDLFYDLQTLQKTGRVHFKAEGRTITVIPK
jgi:ferric-dicitrate binding protein FerR (iron transport regulator)